MPSKRQNIVEASDFEELVFSCGELLLHDPQSLCDKLVETIESNSQYAATTSFAILHAADNLDFSKEKLARFFYVVEHSCTADKMSKCIDYLKRLEHEFYDETYGTFKGGWLAPGSDLIQ